MINMADDVIIISEDDIEIVDSKEYMVDAPGQFSSVPDIARPLVDGAKKIYKHIEKSLYTASALINVIKANIPDEMLQAVLTDEQKQKIAKGALKLMSKKDGSLLASLIDPKTKKIVAQVPLKSVKLSPELSKAVSNYASQMQMAAIAEEIQKVQVAIEDVRQGQESDRLAMAYSCEQKLIQAISITNPQLKQAALLGIAQSAEDSRNLLMLSQTANIEFIKNQPESFVGKLLSGANPEQINLRMDEIRESLGTLNMVSLTEVMAYQELGESEAARKSLEYYAEYIQTTYLASPGLVERLDMIDPSPVNYWSKAIPTIEEKILALPCNGNTKKVGVKKDGKKV